MHTKSVFMLKYIFFFSIFLSIVLAFSPLYAQGEARVSLGNDPTGAWDYNKLTKVNIARTYWALNKFALDNKQALQNFLKFTECQFYDENYGNDFEWRRILRQTKKYINSNISHFPKRYSFIQPISLKRYDFEKKGFPLSERSAYNTMRDMEVVASLGEEKPCKNVRLRHIQGYQRSVALQFQRPFMFTFLPLSERHARNYIDYLQNRLVDTKYDRPAYVKFYVKFSKFIGNRSFRNTNRKSHAMFAGTLEKYEVYADREMKHRLYVHIP